jgi:DNA-binding transcriptional regulator YiaG
MKQATRKSKSLQELSAMAYRYKRVTRDPVLEHFEMIRAQVQMSDAEISRKCGVSTATLRAWRRDGRTRRPQHITLVFVFRAMGYSFSVRKGVE